jgi:hypothetical protein
MMHKMHRLCLFLGWVFFGLLFVGGVYFGLIFLESIEALKINVNPAAYH